MKRVGPAEFLLYATPVPEDFSDGTLVERLNPPHTLRVVILAGRGVMGASEVLDGGFDLDTLDYIMRSPGAPTTPGLSIWTGTVSVVVYDDNDRDDDVHAIGTWRPLLDGELATIADGTWCAGAPV